MPVEVTMPIWCLMDEEGAFPSGRSELNAFAHYTPVLPIPFSLLKRVELISPWGLCASCFFCCLFAFLLKTVPPLHLRWIIAPHHSVFSSNVPSKAACVCHRPLPGFTSSSCFVSFEAFMIFWIYLVYLSVDFIIWCCLSVDYQVHENKYFLEVTC